MTDVITLAPEAPAEPTTTLPRIASVVVYRNRSGYELPAIVWMTEATYRHGRWTKVPPAAPAPEGSPRYSWNDPVPAKTPDRDGQSWESSPVPPVKPGRVHLRVLGSSMSSSPMPSDYIELNVAPGEKPGTYYVPEG